MLADGQFALDGYVFGTARDEAIVLESGFDAGAGEVRDQDHPHPADDRMLFGRDLRTPGVFVFTIGCKRPRGARDVARELGRVWRGDAVRRTPGAVQELAWSLNGQERLVYGRGRRFVVEQGDRIDHDWVVVNADFQLASDAAYGTGENTITLGLVSTALGESGVVLPAVLPWETQLGAQDRKGIVTVATDQPTPFSVTVTGPLAGQASGIRLWSTGWSLGIDTPLEPGDVLTVDTGFGVAALNGGPTGALTRGTKLRARLLPGPQEVTFAANDPTATVTATVRWRDTYNIA